MEVGSMNRVCKIGKHAVEVDVSESAKYLNVCVNSALSEDVIIEILHRLPSKSLAKFQCVSKCWHNYIADCRCQRWNQKPNLVGFFFQDPVLPRIPSRIHFFLSSSKQQVIDGSLDELLDNFRDKRLRIVALSNGFLSLDESLDNFCGNRIRIVALSNGFLLLCNMEGVHYYVYNPATRQQLALPETQISICMEYNPAVGFICKVDNPVEDIISFSIVRYEIPPYWDSQCSVTIESFSSETNAWTVNNIILDVPLRLLHITYMKSPSASVIDGVYFWLDNTPQITVYDSIHKRFWALKLPQDMEDRQGSCFLGLSAGALYFALNISLEETIIVWCLASNIRNQDSVWIKKYVGNVGKTVQQCPEAFGLAGYPRIVVRNMTIHPAVPHMFYLDVLGRVISYDFETDVAEFVYKFGGCGGNTERYKLFSYEWHQWPRLL